MGLDSCLRSSVRQRRRAKARASSRVTLKPELIFVPPRTRCVWEMIGRDGDC